MRLFTVPQNPLLVADSPPNLRVVDPLDALDTAAAEFDRRLQAVTDDQWDKATPCEGWDVRELVTHVNVGNVMADLLFDGCSKEEALEGLAGERAAQQGEDPRTLFASRSARQAAAFRRPGVMEMTVHHPAMDMPGSQLIEFRIGDLALHTWDLARATGGDEELDPALVEHVAAFLEPLRPFIGQTGVFGSGPSGDLPADASALHRLLDLSGRRP